MSATRQRRPRVRLHRPVVPRAVARIARRRPSRRALGIVAGLAVLLAVAWLWFRDSSFVSVNRVTVTGLSGPSVGRIRGALVDAGMTMSTLDVDEGRLRQTVQGYPDVRSLTISTDFPHRLVIHVNEEIPIAAATVNGRRYAVDRNGVLIRRPLASDGRLPTVADRGTDAQGTRLTDSGEDAALAVLGAAPFSLLAHISTAGYTGAHGVVVKLRNGPDLYFGTRDELRSKWAAAVAVLGTGSSAGAQYIDVSDPTRPAAGVTTSTPASTSTATSTVTSTTASATTSSGSTSPSTSG